MKEQDIIYNITSLESRYGNYRSKCLRNLRLFTYSSTTTLDISESEVVGFYQRGTFSTSDDSTSAIQENVIASCIETLCSKIASQKVRPFFNTVMVHSKKCKLLNMHSCSLICCMKKIM